MEKHTPIINFILILVLAGSLFALKQRVDIMERCVKCNCQLSVKEVKEHKHTCEICEWVEKEVNGGS